MKIILQQPKRGRLFFITTLLLAFVFLLGCTQTTAPVPIYYPSSQPTSPTVSNPPTTTSQPLSYTSYWASNQVSAYLNNLATSPEAIRYLADLNSQGYFESIYYPNEVDQDIAGHKYSGWQVYLRTTGEVSRDYWDNLNWAVFKDGYVTEGSNDALIVKADLLELSK